MPPNLASSGQNQHFEELLKEVGLEHQREVEELKQEIQRLELLLNELLPPNERSDLPALVSGLPNGSSASNGYGKIEKRVIRPPSRSSARLPTPSPTARKLQGDEAPPEPEAELGDRQPRLAKQTPSSQSLMSSTTADLEVLPAAEEFGQPIGEVASMSMTESRFAMLSIWSEEQFDRTGWMDCTVALEDMMKDEVEEPEAQAVKRTGCQHLVVSPTSATRAAWDVCGLCMIWYDMITIPLQCFDPERGTFTIFMDWLTLIFWTADMITAFWVGYFDKTGEVIMDPCMIAKRYLTSWFCVDLLVVGPEWLIVVTGDAEGASLAGLGRIFRGARAIRVLRLLRILKLQRLMNMVFDMIDSEYTFIILNLIKLIIFILVLNHVIACLWYQIGKMSSKSGSETGESWIFDSGNVPVYNLSLTWKYFTSLHWSLTQFTPASMDVSARNTPERIFSIIVLFFAMVAFSSIVASVTNSMTALRNLSGDTMKQFWLLRRYLRQNEVETEAYHRIIKFLEVKTQNAASSVTPASIGMLHLLSEPLSDLLAYELKVQHIRQHPLFTHLNITEYSVLVKLCRTVVDFRSFASQDEVFAPGDRARKMYFVKSGTFEYTLSNGVKLKLKPKMWIAEPCLWTMWRHRGTFQPNMPGDLVNIDAKEFAEIVKTHPKPYSFVKSYAFRVVQRINAIPPSRLTDVSLSDDFYSEAVTQSQNAASKRASYTGSADVGNDSFGDI
eukprot:TRINITY_DN104191_c0_g1_i1.p1 TRINITY_DN104191_c0_g1~~TRINITY_DN104191_c0_g1_i1.p1  ORF type:complete len:727 (+),score=122.49 TRINITY_DN104191_c0_g1_i1:65-2245(+)